MMRLIDLNVLLKLVKKNAPYIYGILAPIAMLCPTVEAEPVRHGEWKKFNDEIYCSLCECTALMGTYGGIIKSTYCPHCGAKMDGGANDDVQKETC